jgi:hypothetical protein
VVFSIADHRMADCRKLRSDLILQSCNQFDPDKRGVSEKAFDGISKFGTRRLGISRIAQLLKHTLPSKIVDECTCLRAKAAAQYG